MQPASGLASLHKRSLSETPCVLGPKMRYRRLGSRADLGPTFWPANCPFTEWWILYYVVDCFTKVDLTPIIEKPKDLDDCLERSRLCGRILQSREIGNFWRFSDDS